MRTSLKLGLLAGLMATAGWVWSAGPAGMGGGMGMMGNGPGMMMQGGPGMACGHDAARMQAMQAQRHAALKAALKLSADQEAAWKAFEESAPMGKMAAGMQAMHPDPAEMAKLTTPERLDKMATLRSAHQTAMNAAMDAHIQATKALYDKLSPEQRKVFDAQTLMGAQMAMACGAGHRMHGPGQGPAAGHGPHRGQGNGPGAGPCAATGAGSGAVNCPRATVQ